MAGNERENSVRLTFLHEFAHEKAEQNDCNSKNTSPIIAHHMRERNYTRVSSTCLNNKNGHTYQCSAQRF